MERRCHLLGWRFFLFFFFLSQMKTILLSLMIPAMLIELMASFSPMFGQGQDAASFVADLHNRYRIVANQTYATNTNYECKLDVYALRDASKLNPTVIMIHGGGWMSGTKEITQMHILPYLELGFSVVNVGYRLGTAAPAPAAVEDVRCALRWVFRNAKLYGFDTTAIIVTGHSAGGHLALMTGLLPSGGEFDAPCRLDNDPAPKVAAIINWFGITDVADQIEGGANKRDYATRWFGSKQDVDLAKRLSPLTYVRSGLPPVLTLHGDADPVVPYSHGVRLHEALTKAGVQSTLHTIAKGYHGGFTREATVEAYKVVRAFLSKNNLLRTK
jgi:acetyl esterase/lipase